MNDVLNFAVSIISSLTVSGALTGIMIFLAKNTISERIKNSIKSEYEQKLETHKAQLKASSDREIEKLRAELNLTATEHQVRFSDLHIKRAEIIGRVYEQFVVLFNSGTAFSSPIQSGNVDREVQFRTSMNHIHEFYQYFDRNRIYIPATLCARIVPLVDSIQGKVLSLGIHAHVNLSSIDREQRTSVMDAWNQAWEFFSKEIPNARELLETEFRSLLGDRA